MVTHTTTQRLEAVEARLAQIESRAMLAEKSQKETHDMVSQLHGAFMIAQPGHDRNLLDRMASVAIKVERGSWGLSLILWMAGGVGALSAAWAILRGQGG